MFTNKELREKMTSFRKVYLKSNYEMYKDSHHTYTPNPANFSTKIGVKGEIVNYGCGKMSNKIYVESQIAQGNKAIDKARRKAAAAAAEQKPQSSGSGEASTTSTAEV